MARAGEAMLQAPCSSAHSAATKAAVSTAGSAKLLAHSRQHSEHCSSFGAHTEHCISAVVLHFVQVRQHGQRVSSTSNLMGVGNVIAVGAFGQYVTSTSG